MSHLPTASQGFRSRGLVRVLGAAAVLLGVIGLTACAGDPLADQYRAGSGKNYIAGDGTVTEIAPGNRGAPIVFSGETTQGDTYALADHRSSVTVVNFWYAGCAPCRKEAPDLQAVFAQELDRGRDVSFVGVNVRDQAATAAAFNQTFGVTYPALTDQNGAIQLAFASDVPPNAVPTTLVLDAEGRVAARVLGALADRSILSALIDTVWAETNP